MKRAWDIQCGDNWWLSLGFHLDHTDPSITLHLPLIVICFGRCKQPGFNYSLYRLIKGDTMMEKAIDQAETSSEMPFMPHFTEQEWARLSDEDLAYLREIDRQLHGHEPLAEGWQAQKPYQPNFQETYHYIREGRALCGAVDSYEYGLDEDNPEKRDPADCADCIRIRTSEKESAAA